ncbi:MAG: creatininase family protein [Candidatus Heimdallarchaeota archaeon]
MKTLRMEEMNWVDIGEAVQKGYNNVVIGVGSTEQHGPHLPTQTDAIIADILANKVAIRLGNALQAQTIRIGCSEHHLSFPGTISLKKETLKAILFDYIRSLARFGFKRIIFIPSHGGNFEPLKEALNEIQPEYPEITLIGRINLIKFMNYLFKIAQDFGINQEEAGGHAGELETSQMLAIKEDQVIKDRFKTGYVGPIDLNTQKLLFEKGMTALSKIGVIGDPTRADADRGKKYIEKLVDYIIETIKEICNDKE